MFNKKIILLILLVGLFAVSAVSGEDNVTCDVIGIEDNMTDAVAVVENGDETLDVDDNEVIADNGDGTTFNDLSRLIKNTAENDTLKLEKDYKNSRDSPCPVISKSMTVDGDGHTIDAMKASRIFYINASDVTLKNINFLNAKSKGLGGAVYVAPNSTVSIVNCNFTNCFGEYGGGICFDKNSRSSITESSFINCSGQFGGAVNLNKGAVCEITDSTFKYNVAEVLGGCILGSYADVSLTRSSFFKSTARYESGGAITLIYSRLNAYSMDVTECVSEYGSAITLLDCQSNITYSAFRANEALYDGGAIFAMYGSLVLDSDNFTDNSAQRGGAIYISQTETNVSQSSFTGNFAQMGNAVYAMASEITADQTNVFGLNQNIYQALNDNLTMYGDDYYQFTYQDVIIAQIPGYYSMVDENLLTPVKNQGIDGNCWAFSAMAALESCILKASNVTLDLSEANLKNIMAMFSDYGYKTEVNSGGTKSMALGYLASWLGPIFEDEDTYYTNDYLSPLLKSVLHIQNILVLKREDYTDNDDIKNAILRYGAVSTDMFYDKKYLKNNVSYYYGGDNSSDINHAVCIVGWDDAYSRYNFKDTPSGDGAWIVRNSWGPNWGNAGYFYVSYYDTLFASINSTNSYTFILNDTVRYTRIYQYETEATSYLIFSGRFAAYKNIFTVQGDEDLAAVSTYFASKSTYTVKIYINDMLARTISGKADMGYYTINLADKIHLNPGDNVTVVFNCSAISGRNMMPICSQAVSNNLFLKEGISFFWSGNRWVDNYLSKRVSCIKIFTTSSNSTKANPYFEVKSEGNFTDNSFIISVILPADATGSVIIASIDNQYSINLTSARSLKVYGINSANNVLYVTYSGDDKYLGKSLSHTVDLSKLTNESASVLARQINNLVPGDVLDLSRDYYFEAEGSIVIKKNVTVDGHGHTISAGGISPIIDILADGVTLKNIKFTDAYSNNGAFRIVGDNCTIINCTFTKNYAVRSCGAISWMGENGILQNCTFEDNFAAEFGGAVTWSGTSGKIIGCSFVNNSVNKFGGAVCLLGEDVVISGCTFIKNYVLLYGGGAVYSEGNRSTVSRCLFINNTAPYYGGAVDFNGIGSIVENSSFINCSAYMGGAVSVAANGSAVVNSNFSYNNATGAGGAIYLDSNQSEVCGCIFTDNYAFYYGAAIHLKGMCLSVADSTFANSSSRYRGGALSAFGSQCNILNCSFTAIRVLEGIGGAVYIEANQSKVLNCRFSGNYAEYYGGAIDVEAVGVLISDSSFADNSAYRGGAVYICSNESTILNSNFTRNRAYESRGGAVYLEANKSRISGCLFRDNYATYYGGAVDLEGKLNIIANSSFANNSIDKSGGGAISLMSSENTIIDCNFTDNVAKNKFGGAVYCDAGNNDLINSTFTNTLASNQIYWKNDTGSITGCGFLVTATGNVFCTGDVFIKRSVNLSYDNPSFEYNRPKVISIFSDDILNSIPILAPLKVKLSKGSQTKTFNVNFADGIASLYDELFDLDIGVWSAEATFAGDDNYLPAGTTFTITVENPRSYVNLTANDTMIYSQTTLMAFVFDSGNAAVNTGKVTFLSDGVKVGEANVIEGIASIPYTPTAAGEHTVTAVFAGGIYLGSNDTCKIRVDTISVTVSADDGTVGSNTTLKASLTGLYSIVTDGYVSFYVGNYFAGNAPVNDGFASLQFIPSSAGNRVLKAVYKEKFTSTSNWLVNKAASQLSLNGINGTVGDKLILTASVTNPNGLTINGGTVTFTENGNVIGTATVSNGIARFTYIAGNVGNHLISAAYHGNNYMDCANSVTVSVAKANAELKINDIADAYCNGQVNIGASVVSNNNGLNEGSVQFYINGGEMVSVNVKNGYAGFDYVPVKAGQVNVTAIYTGTDNYFGSNDSASFTVDKMPTGIAASNVNVVYNAGGYVTVTLADANGNPLKSMPIVINKKTLRTDANGQAKLSVNGWAPKTYSVAISFAGDDRYVKSSKSVKVTVKKATPKLTAKKKTFRKSLKIKKYTIILKTNKNKAMKKIKVYLKVKGKTYTAKTNSKGKATFRITKLAKKGTFKATATFKGNKYYNKVSKTVKIKVIK